MEYNNNGIRRQDRLLEEDAALTILQTAEYGVLSMEDTQGNAYGIPVNYVWDGQESIYIHCAPEGRKLDCMRHHPQIPFCVVGKVKLLPQQLTTEYESIVLTGEAHTDLQEEERWHALELFVGKLSPELREKGQICSEKSFHRVHVVRIDIKTWSGKCKHMHNAS